MIPSHSTKLRIVRSLNDLSFESLTAVGEYVEFLRAKKKASTRPTLSGKIVKLGGLWKGYTFSEAEICAARREAWATLGRNVNA